MVETKIKSISKKDYERDWEQQGWKLLHIGPTPSWRIEWGEWESIRDLVQNALDETESFTVEQTGTDLIISDKGAGLAVHDLFLGAQKPKAEHMRGKFGEGLKVAALALLRLGYGVTLETVGRDVVFCMYLQDVDNDYVSTLAALWKPNEITEGTRITIQGYDFSKPTYEDRFAQTADMDMLHKSPSHIKTPTQRYNIIYKSKRGKAAVYARNIFMRDIEGEWSYDLWDFELSPDRHAPRYDFQMWQCISRLWQTITDEQLMVNFFKAIRDKKAKYLQHDLDMSTYRWETTPDNMPYIKIIESQNEKWNRAFIKVFGEGAVLRTGPTESQCEALGRTSIALPQGITEAMKHAVRYDEEILKEVRDRTTEIEVLDDSKLDPRQLLVLNSARELNNGLSKQVSGIFASHLPNVDGKVIEAIYHVPTEQILFTPAVLSSWSKMFECLVHEAGHAYGGSDCTYAHEFNMCVVAMEFAKFIISNSNFSQRYKCIMD